MISPSNLIWDLLQAQPHDEASIMQCLNDHPEYCSFPMHDKLPILIAIRNSLSMDIIKKMISCYPTCLKRRNKRYELLLHELFDYNCFSISLEVLFLVINGNIDAVRAQDFYGRFPLHLECSYNKYSKITCRYEVIVKLLDIYPEAISISDNYNCCPLHLALRNINNTSEVIFYLISLFPKAAHRMDNYGLPPLHIECEKQCRYDVIVKLLEIYPDAIRVYNGHHQYPLHIALTNLEYSTEVIDYLISYYSDAIYFKDNCSHLLPLHIECKYQCRYQVISKLLAVYPGAISVGNKFHEHPLHHTLTSSRSSFEVISYLITLYPDAVRIKDSLDGYLPLHIECGHRCRNVVINKLLDVYPDSISILDFNGRYPLHHALRGQHSTFEIILYLISFYPEAVHKQDILDSLPLHIECNNLCRYDVIIKLLDFYPDAISIPNDKGDMPLHSMLMSETLPAIDTIQMVYNKYPAGVCIRNNVGFIPLCNIFANYYKAYKSVASSTSLMQYKALIVSMINDYHNHQYNISNNNQTIMDCLSINYEYDPLKHRLFLNLCSPYLPASSQRMREYRNINYQARAHLLHHIYQLSAMLSTKLSSNGSLKEQHLVLTLHDTSNKTLGASLYGLMSSLLAKYNREAVEYNNNDDVKYSWMMGDDIGCILFKTIILYL